MDLSFWVCGICMLLQDCICFPAQTGYSIAPGSNLQKSPPTSNQVFPGDSLKQINEDELDATKEQSFVPLQSEPLFYDDWWHFGISGSYAEKMVQSQPTMVDKEEVDESGNGQKIWSRLGKTDQALDKHSFLTKPADSAERILPFIHHGNQEIIQQLAHLPYSGYAAVVLSNHIPIDGSPGAHNAVVFSASETNDVQSGYEHPQKRDFPSSFFSDEELFIDQKPATAVDSSDSPFQDFVSLSNERYSLAPLRYKSMAHRRKYVPKSSSVFDNNNGFNEVGQFHDLSLPKKLIYVLNYQAKNKKKRSKSFYTYKSRASMKSKDGGYPPTSLKKVPPESATNSKLIFPYLGIKTDKLKKKQARPWLAFKVKPPRALSGSNGDSSHQGYQRFNSGPFILAALPEYKEIPSNYEPNDVFLNQHKGRDSVQKASPPQTHLSPISAEERFLFLNGGYEDAMKAGLLKPISQPDSLKMLSDTMKEEPTNFASWPSEMFSDPKDTDLNCIIWNNTKSSSLPKSKKPLRSSEKAYVKLKNRSAKAAAFLSKTCFKPIQRTKLKNSQRDLQ